MQVSVRIPAQLRDLVAGEAVVEISVAASSGSTPTVASVLDGMAGQHPALERRIRDEQGRMRAHVNLFVGSDNIRDLDGLATPLPAGEVLSVIPAVSGG